MEEESNKSKIDLTFWLNFLNSHTFKQIVMNISSTESAQREEFFKKSFRGTFSYNMKVSSVNSFLRSMTQGNMPLPVEQKPTGAEKKHHTGSSKKDSSVH